MKAKVHSAKVPDQDGLRLLVECARTEISSIKHLWLDAGYQGRDKRWAEGVLGLSVEVVCKPPKPVSEKVAKIWAEEWTKEVEKIDWQRLAKAHATARLSGVGEEVGSRENLFVVGTE